jgi:Fe-S oxidoreductase/nitrate reductase gamma subunit
MEQEMEFTREIYWNVGHGFLTLGPMYLLAFSAIGVLVYGFLQRMKVYKQGQTLQRTYNGVARAVEAVKTVLLQTDVCRVRLPGLFHGFFFWGFFLLFVGTTIIVIQADFTDLLFGVKFLKGTFYKLFSITLDIAGLVAIVMLGALLIRRYIFKPEGLETKKDHGYMHALMFVILVTGFIIEGARMAVTELGSPLASWSPVGRVVANVFVAMGEDGLRSIHRFTWWFHFLLVMGFIGSIPFTRFRHIFTTSVNRFFADRGPVGKLTTLDLEDEDAESFGAVNFRDYTWKDIFDADACTLCKRCQDRCPAYATDKPLSPMKIVNQLGDLAFAGSEDVLAETFGKDAIWACTTCRACQDICPASIEHVQKIIDVRRSLVLMEGEFPGEEVMAAMEHTEVNGNPLGLGYASRGEWADGLDLSIMSENSDVDILYFVGCYGSFDKRNIKVAKSFITLCNKAGIKVGILGKEEKCCGEPMRKMGNEYLYQTVAMENVETLQKYGVSKVVTTCPHCFNTLAKDYLDLGLEIEVVPHVVYLEQLVKEGRLAINGVDMTCTYHDSCYLGRHNGIYDGPRNLISAAGGKIIEMEKNRDQAFCCSAGGGRILADENIGSRISVKRAQMAAATGAPQLLSNCPFCLTMFEDGVKGAGLEEQLVPKDIAEILVERIEK